MKTILENLKEKQGLAFFERDEKYNYIDTNNRLVGYDMHAACCEDFDCRIAWLHNRITRMANTYEFNGQRVVFFENLFFAGHINIITPKNIDTYGTENNVALALLVDDQGCPVGCLIAENCHNGYYFHGLEYDMDGSGKITNEQL